MIRPSEILGMNARELLYTSLNSAIAKSYCHSKYATKILLKSRGIPTAEIFGVLATPEDIELFEWEKLTADFVIKPTNGHAGKGVVPFRTKDPLKMEWRDTLGRVWSLEDIKLHCADILQGQYSSHGTQHNVIIEERIPIHPKFLKYSYKGTPDVRIFVFNHVPVLAALRLPTPESEGRANLSQGAIGVGIDIASGTTTFATAHKNQLIKYLPGTKRKLNGLRIPYWNKLLLTAVQASDAAELTFSGVDLFIHKEKGPMVVELNAKPGLSFQVCNQAGLRRRLERVADLQVNNPEHGVRIGQSLFAEIFSDRIKAEEGLVIVKPEETVAIKYANSEYTDVQARLDTGRFRSAIAKSLAQSLKLFGHDDFLWYQTVSEEGKVPVIEVTLKIKGKKITTAMVVLKQLDKQRYKIRLGRRDLTNFLVGQE